MLLCMYMQYLYFYSKSRETKKFVNDGRAPDTTKTLLDIDEKKDEKNEEKSTSDIRNERAARHAERIKENKKRNNTGDFKRESKRRKTDSSDADRSMHNERKFKSLRLSCISVDVLEQCHLDADDVLGWFNPKGDGYCDWRAVSVVLNNYDRRYDIVKLTKKYTLENEKVSSQLCLVMMNNMIMF
ncbi:hypothetical protein BDA99DRAFT_556657 [Phascolomyces articulosus]|uniref:OTU domain-containing protein n=1 Tax=Phascolomyces articulosus TaxID=60185 RepID=A0AAD5KK45_9FUNG|nr:hypothetical protein BDA99DRAFT_556657 [Phascolomyces articulosus]